MKLKNALVLVVLAGAVLAATAQGISRFGEFEAAPARITPYALVLKALNAGDTLVDGLVSGEASEQNIMLLAGLALLGTIVRRSTRRNS